MSHYPHNHPFSPNYVGAVARQLANPRYPNRQQTPTVETKRKLSPPTKEQK